MRDLVLRLLHNRAWLLCAVATSAICAALAVYEQVQLARDPQRRADLAAARREVEMSSAYGSSFAKLLDESWQLAVIQVLLITALCALLWPVAVASGLMLVSLRAWLRRTGRMRSRP